MTNLEKKHNATIEATLEFLTQDLKMELISSKELIEAIEAKDFTTIELTWEFEEWFEAYYNKVADRSRELMLKA